MESFQELLEAIKPQINWKVSLNSDTLKVYHQVDSAFFEELSLHACKMYVRDIYNSATPSTVSSLVSAILEDRDRLFDQSLFLHSRRQVVGFLNGVFDLNTGKVRKYHSSDFIVNPLPHKITREIDKDADKWFLGILKNWVGEETGDWFMNLLSYLLFIYPNGEDIWCNFFGAGSNGKSVCLELLERILGDDKVIGCDLRNINRFSGDAFQDKWLVVGRDSSNQVSDNATSFIKTFSGDAKLLVERKGGDSFDVPNQGKLIVSTNNLIQSKDRSYAWYRRLFPIPFPKEFSRNEQFKQSLFKRIPEITRSLLHRAYLYKHNEASLFESLPSPVKQLMRETRMLNDRVTAFWEIHFFREIDGGSEMVSVLDHDKVREIDGYTMSQLYFEFCQWHIQEFGETAIEPSLKTFGGAYGAFLSSPAGKYFEYRKTKEGRRVALVKNLMEKSS